jgi:tripartite-type tricarboxylate transporter receptor subunit TctC
MCTRRKRGHAVLGIAFMLLAWPFEPTSAAAEDFPSRPLTIMVPFAAGGGVDAAVRKFATVVSQSLHQPVVVQNRPGGGGVVAATATLRAGNDGYTLFVATPSTHASMEFLQSMPFDAAKDFRAVTELFYFQNMLVVPDQNPSSTFDQFIKFAKAKPDGLVYGSPGYGSPAHLMGALLGYDLQIRATHTPFKNGPDFNLSLLKSEIDYGFGTYWGMESLRQAGKVRVLAIAAPKRADFYPDVPSFTELGYPNLGNFPTNWYGLVVPSGTPDVVIRILAEEFQKAAKEPGILSLLRNSAFIANVQGPDAFKAEMAKDTAVYKEMIHSLGIKRVD